MDITLELCIESNEDGSPQFTFEVESGSIRVRHVRDGTDSSIDWARLVRAIILDETNVGIKTDQSSSIEINDDGDVTFGEHDSVKSAYTSFIIPAKKCLRAFSVAACVTQLWENHMWNPTESVHIYSMAEH